MTVIAKKTHTPKYIYVYIHWNDDEKKYVYNVNLPLGVSPAGLWPKTDHWQTDKTRTVTTMCWVFIFFFLLLLLLYLFLIGIFFFFNCSLLGTARYFISSVFCAVSQKKNCVWERERERENQSFKICQNQLNQFAFFLSIGIRVCRIYIFSVHKGTH